ncbi:type II and III secretion system protein family protein [uncultured Pseudodesulfovibrio sp.]|uniref:type II and III secretion system protein family protein n=1 Tax=uncultured Pseudodesulfovibrio sp. TaxID=2035858 RepID=UPI0029C7D40B|nr:type II and III secretion system protein family protein [uncultured Pseudodesulfovibrio sp.]
MFIFRNILWKILVGAAVMVAVIGAASYAMAKVDVLNTEAPGVIRLVAGKSTILNVDKPVSRVSLSSEEAASIIILSPKQIYITAKELGTSTLTLWSGKAVSNIYDLVVTPDVTRLKRMIHEIFPQETAVQVLSSGESITLSGSVNNTGNLTSILALAEAEAPEKVVNLLRVDGVQQVMLEVRVAEMSRTVIKRLGINFISTLNSFTFYSFLNNLTQFTSAGDGTVQLNKVNGIVNYTSKNFNIRGYFDALKANGLIRTLAEPTLTCVSGESADFLVGGEIPIPIPQALGNVAIEFKPFGIGLSFTPTVMSSGLINLQVAPEVSELDYTKKVNLSGFEIPAITTRRAATVIDLADGQSFAIAGLISDQLRENNNRFPGLGDIPILGTLFSSKDFEKSKTELVIIVTAHLAKPLDMEKQTLPTDGFKEADDFEFYMLGLLEGRKDEPKATPVNSAPDDTPQPGTVVRPESGFDGQFGHTWPK